MKHKGPAHPERSFGRSVGGVLILVAAYLAWRGRTTPAAVTGAIGVVLVTLGQFAPTLLKWPSAAWWKFAMVLGHVNARIILSVIFLFVLVPLGLTWRLIGRDPLARRRQSWPGWAPYPERYRDRTHYTRMF
jgi:hypothetical protein